MEVLFKWVGRYRMMGEGEKNAFHVSAIPVSDAPPFLRTFYRRTKSEYDMLAPCPWTKDESAL